MHVGILRRAMVELERALRENSVCREPLFSGLHNPEEVLARISRLWHARLSEAVISGLPLL